MIPSQLEKYNIIPISKTEKAPLVEKLSEYIEGEQYPREKLTNTTNYGVMLGENNHNLIIIDIDDEAIYNAFYRNEETFTVQTPSGGYHLYYHTTNVEELKETKRLTKYNGWDVDILTRGYAVIPPSKYGKKEYKIVKNTEIQEITSIEEKLQPLKKLKLQREVDVEQFKDQINLREIISQYTHVNKQGFAKCPFHADTNPSLHIYDKGHSNQHWYCFGCQTGGDAITFIEKIENCEFKEAIEILSKKTGIETPYTEKVNMVGGSAVVDRKYLYTDYENARRLVGMWQDDIRYCYTQRQWYIWNGKIWKRDEDGEIYQLAKKTIRAEYLKAAEIDEPEKKQEVLKKIISCENQSKLKAMVESAENEPEILIDYNVFDQHKDLVCVKNGVLNLRSGEILPFEKEYYITRQIDVVYNPVAKCPRFEAFLDEIMAGNENLKRFLQRYFGYSLTGHTSEQVFCLFYGTGANGKGTLVDTIMSILGDYAGTARRETILETRSDNTNTADLADLKGKRFVVVDETKQGAVLDVGVVKQITGQNTIKCRFLYRDFFEYVPEFKLVVVTNHEPEVKGVDHAIWRRILKVPFDVQIPRERWDLKLREKLLAEKEGIFRWMVEGAVDWYLNGLDVPPEVRESTEEYREDSDILGDFIKTCLILDKRSELPVKELYEIYTAWCESRNEYRLSKKGFVSNLTDRGIKNRRTRNTRLKVGVDLNPLLKELINEHKVWTLCEDERKDILKKLFVTEMTHFCSFGNFSIREKIVEKSYGNSENASQMSHHSEHSDFERYRFNKTLPSSGNEGLFENKNLSDENKNLSVSCEDKGSTKLNSLNDNCRKDYEIRKPQAEIMKEVYDEISSYTPANYDIAKNIEINRLQREYNYTEDEACEIVDRVLEDIYKR